MSALQKVKHILVELKGHAPFTLLGAVFGIGFMLIFRNVGRQGSHTLFSIFHPAHVVLSAMVTASMFWLHTDRKRVVLIILVGYFGSVGIATLSDVIIPYIGTRALGLDVPAHSEVFHSEHEHEEHEKIHLGFIEEWYLVNPAAFLGILIAYYIPRTKFPHAFHILISTWASSSYLLMSMREQWTVAVAAGVLATLFIATWLPCCISDIVFPLLFVKSDLEIAGACPLHTHHSHQHEQFEQEPCK